MNPFLNPITAIPFIKNFIVDPGRLQRLNPKKMEKYRDKALRKSIKYALTVQLYQKKYQDKGIHENNIKGIKDIVNLPFISKNDIIEHFPDDIVPKGYNKDKAQVVCTSGSTGKPVSFYIDFPTVSGTIGMSIRELRFLNLHWRKSRIAHVGAF